MDNYTREDIELLWKHYDFEDCRTWPYYPIVMPLKNGRGRVWLDLVDLR